MTPPNRYAPANDTHHADLQALKGYLAGAIVSAFRCRGAASDALPAERTALLAAAERYDECARRYVVAVDRAERQGRRACA